MKKKLDVDMTSQILHIGENLFFAYVTYTLRNISVTYIHNIYTLRNISKEQIFPNVQNLWCHVNVKFFLNVKFRTTTVSYFETYGTVGRIKPFR